MNKQFITLVRNARVALQELERVANQDGTQFRYRIATASEYIQSVEDTYYEVLRYDASSDEPIQLKEIK